VESIVENCGHTVIRKCHDKKPNCSAKCYIRLDCGHACERNCHINDDPDHEKVELVFSNMFHIVRYNNNNIILNILSTV